MSILIDVAGNRYQYTTMNVHGDSVTIDGGLIIQGKIADFIIESDVKPQTAAEIRRSQIEAELTAIDAASARPLRAILTATTSGGTADVADIAKLAELEAQAKALREELATLVN